MAGFKMEIIKIKAAVFSLCDYTKFNYLRPNCIGYNRIR
jgi:hypothetical protein